MNESDKQEHSQFSLLKYVRFAPFFWTQFFGAFNDNVFKNGLMALITFGILSSSLELSQMNNLGAMLFILPFFLFSALAGQLADKYEKSTLIRYVKLFEIFIMVVGGLCFWFHLTWGLMLMLFLMGTQSAFFGPVKYSIIPQHLRPDELVGGNALVETGTFLAILLGTITAGVVSDMESATRILPFLVVLVAIVGYLVCLKIPQAPAPSPDLTIRFNPIKETWHTVQFSR